MIGFLGGALAGYGAPWSDLMNDYQLDSWVLSGRRRPRPDFVYVNQESQEPPSLHILITPEVAMRQALRPWKVELTPEYLAKIPAEDRAWLAKEALLENGEIGAPRPAWRYIGDKRVKVPGVAAGLLPDLTLDSLPMTWLSAAKAEVTRLAALAVERRAEASQKDAEFRERQDAQREVTLKHHLGPKWWQFWRRW